MLTAIFTKEKIRSKNTVQTTSILQGLKAAFSNSAYLLLLVTYLLSWTTINFVQNNLLLFVKYVVKLPNIFSYLLLVVQLSSAIFLPIVQLVSKKIGKKYTYFIGMFTLVIDLIFMFFLKEGQVVETYICAAIAGIGVATGLLIPWSMLPDVIDLDEVRTGKRREGDLYSFFLLFQKIGLGGALAFSSYTLGWVGYVVPTEEEDVDPNFNQPDSVRLALRLMVTLIPVGILLVSFVVVFFYPITKAKHKKILDEIAAVRNTLL